MVRRYLAQISEAERATLKGGLTDYLTFRKKIIHGRIDQCFSTPLSRYVSKRDTPRP